MQSFHLKRSIFCLLAIIALLTACGDQAVQQEQETPRAKSITFTLTNRIEDLDILRVEMQIGDARMPEGGFFTTALFMESNYSNPKFLVYDKPYSITYSKEADSESQEYEGKHHRWSIDLSEGREDMEEIRLEFYVVESENGSKRRYMAGSFVVSLEDAWEKNLEYKLVRFGIEMDPAEAEANGFELLDTILVKDAALWPEL
ncbi:MAG: hypothetical protein K2P20_00380 [Oscillospiraceae bacterium]|nr:hypothetical protein [Oscillospiraceae bacterium]